MIIEALIAGSILAVCFPLGAAIALNTPLNHRIIATVMAVGAGLLLAAVSLDLMRQAVAGVGVGTAIGVMLGAAALFSGVNAYLSTQGAKHRKRCGECVSQPSENEHPNSGAAIAAGTVMDALPEAIVVGVVVASGGHLAPLVAAIAGGNIAQSLSSSAGLHEADRSRRFIYGLWFAVAAAVVVLTVGSAMLLGSAGASVQPWIEAFAAGILLAMVAEAMLPEAVHEAPRFSGLYAAAGFGAFILLGKLL